jgi:hypothetical protein
MNRLGYFLSFLFVGSLFLPPISKVYYLNNSSFPNKLIVNPIDNDFRMVVELIGVCVLNYFNLFKVCYLGSINVILICVTNYFITFNYLFMGSLNLIKVCIENSYIFCYNIIDIITSYPNNYLIFIYLITKLYLNNRLRGG